MDGVELLTRAHAAGLMVRADGEMLVIRGPRSAEALVRELLGRKPEILAHLQRVDLPWPMGYGGLSAEEVTRAEAQNVQLGVTDPVKRRLNVLSWMRCHYRNLGNLEMAQKMKEAYHELHHADPTIRAICGLCEYRDAATT